MPEYHALLSPSSAARWINCPASVKLCKDIPSTTSQYAEAGRLAHSIAELKARKKFVDPTGPRKYAAQLKKLQSDPNYAPEMDSYTDVYIEVLTEHSMSFDSAPLTVLEVEVPIGVFTGENRSDGVPSTGTADCIQIGGGILWVTDYKNGSGVPVHAEQNPQMMLYALGALYRYRPFFGTLIRTVKMTIVQPAISNVSDWDITVEELEAWAQDVVSPAASQALAGGGRPNPGEWCKSHFCPLRNTCRARAEKYLALEVFGGKRPPVLSDAEIGYILVRGRDLSSWLKDLEEYALSACLEGKNIPGWKAVEGRKTRAFADLDAAINTLVNNGYPLDVIYDRIPKSLSQLEKMLGKATFAELLGNQVIKPRGKPTLAEESDKRLAYNAAAIAFKEDK